MTYKAKKKLIKRLLDNQNAEPQKLPRIISNIDVCLPYEPISQPFQEKFRGHKIKPVMPYSKQQSAPGRLF